VRREAFVVRREVELEFGVELEFAVAPPAVVRLAVARPTHSPTVKLVKLREMKLEELV
jgi:ribosomal protein L19